MLLMIIVIKSVFVKVGDAIAVRFLAEPVLSTRATSFAEFILRPGTRFFDSLRITDEGLGMTHEGLEMTSV